MSRDLTATAQHVIADVGFLRWTLGAVGLVTIVCRFLEPQTAPWDLLVGQVVPPLVVMVAWVLPFDAFMSRVLVREDTQRETPRYVAIIIFDIVLLAALLIVWGPFFYDVLQPPV